MPRTSGAGWASAGMEMTTRLSTRARMAFIRVSTSGGSRAGPYYTTMGVFSIALIGGGGISRAHIAAAQASEGRIGVAAVVDPSESARKGVADVTGAAAFAAVEQLLGSDEIGRASGRVFVAV